MTKPYAWLRQMLFCMDPEQAHHQSMRMLKTMSQLPLGGLLLKGSGLLPLHQQSLHRSCVNANIYTQPTSMAGITVKNPVGLAAGFDKNGEYIDILFALGFGFIEIGTVTPRAQDGNPKPRLFRLPEHEAIINRMGFNNLGVDHLIGNVIAARKHPQSKKALGVIGINIGKNADTPIENALEDYRIGLDKVFAHADYITINISSPNTKNLRSLQTAESLRALLEPLRERHIQQQQLSSRQVPLFVKIAPDIEPEALVEMAEVLKVSQGGIGVVDGVIATNTSIGRVGVESHPMAAQAGGLSGAPIFKAATAVQKQLHQLLPHLPIIGVGGINSVAQALEKKAHGAQVVQIYSGFIYHGPALIKEILRAWSQDQQHP